MVSDHDADIVQFDEQVHTIEQLMDLAVVVLLTIEEVNHGIDHHDVRLMKCNLIRDSLDVSIPHEVLSQSPGDDQIVVTHGYQVLTGCESSVVQLNPLLEKLCDDLCLQPHHLQRPAKRHIHKVSACSCTRCKPTKPVRLTDLWLAK